MAGTDVNTTENTPIEDSNNTLTLTLDASRTRAPKPSFLGLEKNLFLIKFQDERDKRKILEGEPWHFDRSVLVLRPREGTEQPSGIELFQTLFWLQIDDLPFQYRDPEIAVIIGKKLGFLMDVYEEEGWDIENFMRVRILLDLSKPLRKELAISIAQGESFHVLFKYENLPNFYFIYGRLGHTIKDCTFESDEDEDDGETQYQFSDDLRAPHFRKKVSITKKDHRQSTRNSFRPRRATQATSFPAEPEIVIGKETKSTIMWRS
ncbi:hypothetical protein Tsubulata_000170 [Turnera subulata]|uniref:DUF4283 domain-containing protein n=1 Tax=Turnera subulata TaxID=218843 RepID=A0A9Q0JM44_9ROSI|nr:hypothetical protein Tsubulata_000170 [Turnera subulata]